MSISSLSAAIKTVLTGVSSLREIYEYEKAELSGFPAVCITPSETSAETLDSGNDLRTYRFLVRVYYAMKNDTEDAEVALQEAANDILDALANAGRLGGIVDFPVSAAPGKWGYVDLATGKARTAEIEVICKKAVSITL